jgi:hypothetical protein
MKNVCAIVCVGIRYLQKLIETKQKWIGQLQSERLYT